MVRPQQFCFVRAVKWHAWGTPTFNCYFRSLVISIRVPTAINQHSHTHTRMRRIYTRGINYRVLTEPTFVPFTYRRKHKIYACVRNECDVRMTRAGRRAHNSHQSDYATVSCFLFPVFFLVSTSSSAPTKSENFDSSRLIRCAHAHHFFLNQWATNFVCQMRTHSNDTDNDEELTEWETSHKSLI